MIKQLLNSVDDTVHEQTIICRQLFAGHVVVSNEKEEKLATNDMSRRSMICLSLRLRQIIDLLATDNSQYFAQPCPMIVNYLHP